MPKINHVCLQCQKLFVTYCESSKFCSYACKGLHRTKIALLRNTPEIIRNRRNKAHKKWVGKNRDAVNIYQKKLRSKRIVDPKFREWERQSKKDYKKKTRLDVMMKYGGLICSCDHNGKPCGPHPYEFLAIDHINGGGRGGGRAEGVIGQLLIHKLRRLKYPPGYRVLCHNCNFSLGVYGKCPMSNTETQDIRKPPMGEDHWYAKRNKLIHSDFS